MEPDTAKEKALRLINAMLTGEKAVQCEQELLVLRSLLDPIDEEELKVMIESADYLIKYHSTRILKNFNVVRKKVLTDHRRACDKCGIKCRYIAVIDGDKVCYKCYEEFRKMCKREAKDNVKHS